MEVVTEPFLGVLSEQKLEIITVFLLGLTALLTAWASYQAAQWNSVSDDRYAAAGILQDQAQTMRENGFSIFEEDHSLFLDYVREERTGDANGAMIIRRDLMTKRLRDAVDSWEKAPTAGRETTPFSDKYGYTIQQRVDADKRYADSRTAIGHARGASHDGGNYSLAAVMLAAGLFLLGISGTLTFVRIRLTLIGVGCVFLVGTLAWMLVLPKHLPL